VNDDERLQKMKADYERAKANTEERLRSAPRHPCPICNSPLVTNPRYPNAVCVPCHERAVDEHGRALRFSNIDITGGFRATVVENGELHESHICFIDGVRCWADEAYLGGIVVIPK
jgi:hypothetical protein